MPHRIRVTKKTKRSDAIREVFTTEDTAEANARLASGWSLLYGGVAHRDQFGYNVKPVFVLARTKDA